MTHGIVLASIHSVGNAIEAVVWFAMAGIVLAMRARPNAPSGRFQLAAITLLAFGASDIVEIQTGAWWKPWWLLVWKGACILLLVSLWWTRPRPKTQPDAIDSRP